MLTYDVPDLQARMIVGMIEAYVRAGLPCPTPIDAWTNNAALQALVLAKLQAKYTTSPTLKREEEGV